MLRPRQALAAGRDEALDYLKQPELVSGRPGRCPHDLVALRRSRHLPVRRCTAVRCNKMLMALRVSQQQFEESLRISCYAAFSARR